MARKQASSDAGDFQRDQDVPGIKSGRNRWIAWLGDRRTHQLVGFFLMLSGVYLVVAFISFLFTWKVDQSAVLDAGWGMFLETNPEAARNWLGIVGAVLAHAFIHKGFGIAAFIFPLLFFALGFRIVFRVSIIPLGRTLRYGFFVIPWLSVALSLLFSQGLFFLGGAFGYEVLQWMRGLMGYTGSALFLGFYALGFAIIAFNLEFYRPPKPKPMAQPESTKEPIPDPDFFTHKNDIPEEERPETEAFPPPFVPDEEEGSLDFVVKTREPEPWEMDPSAQPEEPNPDDGLMPDPSFQAVPPVVGLVEPELEVEVPEPEPEAPTAAAPTHFGIDTPYDPQLDYASYKFPTLDLLQEREDQKARVSQEELEENKKLIVETLRNYNIGIDKIKATIGPTVTLYEIVPMAGVRISKIKNLEDDIALSLAALGIRIIAPIPGKGTIGIEVPNQKPEVVSMHSVLSSPRFQNADAELPIVLGRTISNEVYLADLAKMPHLLMAGATGQGKSVGINTILTSLLYKKHPSELKLVLVDPKKVELSLYKSLERFFLAKVPGEGDAIITDTKLVVNTLNSLCELMDHRYDLLKDAGVRNIREYNPKFKKRQLNPEKGHHFMPYIVVVIDELADLMMTAGKDVEYPIGRLAQLARAIGIHLILATQRPSVNIITGTIKANFPARIAFKVSSKIDSRTILDANGADQLIGKGDMLVSNGADLIRVQCAFVDTPEVEAFCEFIGNQNGRDVYLLPAVKMDVGIEDGFDASDDSGERDALFEEAARIVVQTQQGSTSLLQRRLKLGYNRAGRLIDQLERAGIVGAFTGTKSRDVLVPDLHHLESLLGDIDQQD